MMNSAVLKGPLLGGASSEALNYLEGGCERCRNTATQRSGPLFLGGVTFQPGEAKSVNVFLPYAELGLTKISDEPAVPSPILMSEKVELDPGVPQTLNIPWGGRESAGDGSMRYTLTELGDGITKIEMDFADEGVVGPA